jgi:hypothetical protein
MKERKLYNLSVYTESNQSKPLAIHKYLTAQELVDKLFEAIKLNRLYEFEEVKK